MIREIADNQVDIWQADLSDPLFLKLLHYFHILSKSEQKIADNFNLPCHRQSYILSHIILRLLLSKYLGTPPELIEFYKHKYGKPFIKWDMINFNMSHSKKKLAIVFANCEVGVDIEYININFDIDEIVNMCLTEDERANIDTLEPHLQKKLFYSYWTQKEALLKSIGIGLNISPNKINFAHNSVYDSKTNTYKIKKRTVATFNSFDKSYVGHIAYKHKDNKIIKYHNCNEFHFI